MKILDVIFPRRCILCGNIIEKETESGLCGLCRWQDYLSPQPVNAQGRCSFLYQDQLQRAIFKMKYEGRRSYAKILAGWMAQEGGEWARQMRFDLVTAVPLAKKRMKLRGYNQAELLGRELSRLLQVPYKELLLRSRDTDPQNKLGEMLRRQNMEGAFRSINSGGSAMRICLVDDIFTTGSTIEACETELKKAFPEAEIWYWVLSGRISSKNL